MINWKEEKERINHLLNVENLSYEEVGRLYGCSGSNIRKQVKKLHIIVESRRRISDKETFNKGKRLKENAKTVCPICGGKKNHVSVLCKKCSDKEKRTIRKKFLGDYIGHNVKEQYVTHKCSQIRKDARRFMEEESKQEKVCFYCKNHEFDDILEVHHVKGILEFSPDTRISDINCDGNLVWLCPNHHAMVEKGLIEL